MQKKTTSSNNFERKSLSVADIESGIKLLSNRKMELDRLSTNANIDNDKLNAATRHFSRNVAEIFGENSVEYSHYKEWPAYGHIGSYHMGISDFEWQHKWQAVYRDGLKSTIIEINSLISQLEEKKQVLSKPELVELTTAKMEQSCEVFIVYGHASEALVEVENFLRKLKLKLIILSDKPNMGATIIEKFEREGAFSGFAVVILTGDDVGGLVIDSSKAPELKPRARQNVILELGYFVGKLGRNRVATLYKPIEGFEFPSDYHGMVYTSMDSEKAWQLKLAKELKAANIMIDAQALLQ